MSERMIEANGVQLCTESFGDPAHPPVLLVMGIGASMLWWDEDLCQTMADRGRFVIRYDHRDTGRSSTSPPGRPDYTGADLASDAVGVLDAHGVASAHVVGVSAGGGIAQSIALERPERVRSLVLISTSPITPVDRELPSPTDAFVRFASAVEVDWSDPESVIEYLVAWSRVLAGGQRPFDEAGTRRFVRRDVERARDVASLQNHDLLAGDQPAQHSIAAISAPTLVVHGTADPMFPLGHGEALAATIPGARLLTLEGAGHGVEHADRDRLAEAIVAHTGSTPPNAGVAVNVIPDGGA